MIERLAYVIHVLGFCSLLLYFFSGAFHLINIMPTAFEYYHQNHKIITKEESEEKQAELQRQYDAIDFDKLEREHPMLGDYFSDENAAHFLINKEEIWTEVESGFLLIGIGFASYLLAWILRYILTGKNNFIFFFTKGLRTNVKN